MAPTLQFYVINAVFHPDRIGNPDPERFPLFTFSGDNIDPSTREITVWRGIAMIIFNLSTEQIGTPPFPSDAKFQFEPVQWFQHGDDGKSTGNPAIQPNMFTLQRIGDNTVTLIDFNSNQSPALVDKSHVFNLVVTYDNNTYGSDPTIINEPEDG
jgi:hypothetical protein